MSAPEAHLALRDADAEAALARILLVGHADLAHTGLWFVLARQPWVRRAWFAPDVRSAERAARTLRSGMVLVGPELDGLPARAVLRRLSLADDVRVALVQREHPSARELRECGAHGYISPDWAPTQAAAAARRLHQAAPAVIEAPPESDVLSARELQVLRGLARGETNEEIGRGLELSPSTVKYHTRSVYRKLDARNRAHAVERGRWHGLLR